MNWKKSWKNTDYGITIKAKSNIQYSYRISVFGNSVFSCKAVLPPNQRVWEFPASADVLTVAFLQKRQSVATRAMLALILKVIRASTTFSLNLKCQFKGFREKVRVSTDWFLLKNQECIDTGDACCQPHEVNRAWTFFQRLYFPVVRICLKVSKEHF